MGAATLDAPAPDTVLNHFGRFAREGEWADHCVDCDMCDEASLDRGGLMLELSQGGALVGFEVVR